jgi:hypothetical protein
LHFLASEILSASEIIFTCLVRVAETGTQRRWSN